MTVWWLINYHYNKYGSCDAKFAQNAWVQKFKDHENTFLTTLISYRKTAPISKFSNIFHARFQNICNQYVHFLISQVIGNIYFCNNILCFLAMTRFRGFGCELFLYVIFECLKLSIFLLTILEILEIELQ